MPFIVACALFFVFGRGGDARPLGGKRKRNPARRQEETQVR